MGSRYFISTASKRTLSGMKNEVDYPLYIFCWNMLESAQARILLIKSSHKWTRMLYIISNSKLGIWICSQPRIDLNSQSNFYDVLTRPYKYLSNTLSTLYTRTTCTQHNLHVSFTIFHTSPPDLWNHITPTSMACTMYGYWGHSC